MPELEWTELAQNDLFAIVDHISDHKGIEAARVPEAVSDGPH